MHDPRDSQKQLVEALMDLVGAYSTTRDVQDGVPPSVATVYGELRDRLAFLQATNAVLEELCLSAHPVYGACTRDAAHLTTSRHGNDYQEWSSLCTSL